MLAGAVIGHLRDNRAITIGCLPSQCTGPMYNVATGVRDGTHGSVTGTHFQQPTPTEP